MKNLYGNSKINPYLEQQIMTASPEKLILMLYDLGIKSCRKEDRQKAAQVIVELIGALNFEYKEMALRFYELYRFALDHIHKNSFKEPLMVFEGLKDAWDAGVMKSKAQLNN